MHKTSLWLLGILIIATMVIGCGNDDSDTVDGDTTDGDAIDGDTVDGDTTDGDDAPDGDDEPDGDSDAEESEPWYSDTPHRQPTIPACGSGGYTGHYLIPGPGEAGYDAELAAKARAYDRGYHAFIASATGTNQEATINLENTEKRDLVTRFYQEYDGWDFAEFSGGQDGTEMVDQYHKVAGLYGGFGIMADAMRYQVLRDQGADCAEIEIARQQLLRSLEALHRAFVMGGVPGVVVRGYQRNDLPGAENIELTPLFDDSGNPLPEEKDNGTWRADNSGQYPNYYWEDSCSRDMMLGWMLASAVCQEVMRFDDSFDESLRQRIRDDILPVAEAWRVVRDSGYDLEFPDADGRTTYHGYVNENSIERDAYLAGFENGFYAIMALGMVAAQAYASDDPETERYLYEDLIQRRQLHIISRDHMIYMNMGLETNWSNYNMAFVSAFLAYRYIRNEEARAAIAESIAIPLYDTPDTLEQPVDVKHTPFDFIFLGSKLGESPWQEPIGEVDLTALGNGLETLDGFVFPPYWDEEVIQCDEAELASGDCTLSDGTEVEVYDGGGRKGSTVCDTPVPKAIRRPSNFEWRSNPYNVNGGGNGATLMPGVDFRGAYWLGRWMQIPK